MRDDEGGKRQRKRKGKQKYQRDCMAIKVKRVTAERPRGRDSVSKFILMHPQLTLWEEFKGKECRHGVLNGFPVLLIHSQE